MKRRLFSLFLALVMCLSLLPTAAFAEGDTDTTDTDGATITGTTITGTTITDTTITGTDTTGKTGETTTTATGGTDSTTAAPADTTDDGGDEDAAPTPVVQSGGTPVVLGAAEYAHTAHCTCATEHTGEKNDCSSEPISGWSMYPNLIGTGTLPTSGACYLTGNIALDSTWEITDNLCLCLNGHTITANGDFPAITVKNGAKLYLTDCAATSGTITHSTSKSGSGVKVESGGTFNLYGGSITGNSGTNITTTAITGNCGGGVYIAPGGTFNMYGGSITNNMAANSENASGGGGVYIEPVTSSSAGTTGGTFNMYGGSITNNTVTGKPDNGSLKYFYGGGGVFVGDYCTFNMSGGTISGNSATRGGGVYVNGGLFNSLNQVTFTMSGGSITGNNATVSGGGVYGGAYHKFASAGATYPSETAENTFQLSGSASVTDNTLGSTKGSDGKYTNGTANNMYVPSWVYSIHVAAGFTGSFGVTVDEEEWVAKVGTTKNLHGQYWKVVRYEDSSGSSTSGGTINYDNERFTFHSKGTVNEGKVTCNHLYGAGGGGSNYKCSFCGSNSVVAEVTFANGSQRCYESLPTAIEKAGDDGTVKLLQNVTINVSIGSSSYSLKPGAGKTVKLDLNGKTCTITAGDSITIANGTLEITSNTGSIDNLKVANGAKLIVSGTNPTINSLTVEAGGAVQLKGGKYGSITVADGMTCNDLLPDGKAFYLGDAVMDGEMGSLTGTDESKITVKTHTCAGFNEGKCNGCGRKCPHSSIGTDGKCSGCTMQMVAQVTKANGGIDSKTAYFASFKDAVDSINTGDSNVTITLLYNHAVNADLTIDKACTLDLNGKVLTIDTGKKLTVSSTVTIKGTADSQIDGEGSEIDGKVVAGPFANLTIEENPKIGNLTVKTEAAAENTVTLKGGTFGSINIEQGTGTSRMITSLLAPGYAFETTTATTPSSDPRIQYLTVSTRTSYDGLKVVQCSSHGVSGDGGNNKCLFCNTAFAVSVNVGSGRDAYTYYKTVSEAVEYINTLTDTTTHIYIKLLADVKEQDGGTNKTITLDRRNPLTLSLNGKTLTADIEVASGTTLTVNGISGTLNGTLTVASGGNAKLSSGTFSKITVAGSSVVGDLLADGYGYRSTTEGKAWVESSTLGNTTTLTSVSVQKIPLTTINVTASSNTITHGDSNSTTTLTVRVTKPTGVDATPSYSWSRRKAGGTTMSNVGTDATLTVAGNTLDAGTYEFSCTVTVDGYSLESNVTITVNKADLSEDIKPTAEANLTFKTEKAGTAAPTAVAQKLVTAPIGLPDGCTAYYSLDKSTWVTSAAAITATNAGTYTIYWYITGSDNYNDVGSKDDPRELTVQIDPMKVAKDVPTTNPEGIQQLYIKHRDSQNGTWCDNGTLTYTYTGEPITPMIQLVDVNDYVIPTSGYSVTYGNNTEASSFENDATITIKDTDPNDNFEIVESEFPFTIAPKTVTLSPSTYTYYAKKTEYSSTISFSLTEIAEAMGMPTNDGALTFMLASDPAATSGMSIVEIDGDWYLKISNAVVTGDTPYKGKVYVSSANHKGSFNVVVHVIDRGKDVPAFLCKIIEKDYDGTALTATEAGAKAKLVVDDGSTISIAGTWKWEGSGTGPTNVTDSGRYLLTFTPTGDDAEDYTSVTKAVQVTINARSLADGSITATADGGVYSGKPIKPTLTVKYQATNGTLTLTEGTDYTVTGDTSKTDAGTYSVKINGIGNYSGERTVQWTITPCTVSINSTGGGSKLYDGTTAFPSGAVSASFTTGSVALPFKPGEHYNVSNVQSDGANVGYRSVSAKVTLLGDNCVFAAGTEPFYTSEGGKTATMYANCNIWPYPLETRPTVKQSVIKLQQDVSVSDGSHPLFGNVNAALMDVSAITDKVLGSSMVIIPKSVGIELGSELHFALGQLPAKVKAQIDEGGILTYSISGGKAGDKLAIPVTVTMPNLASYEFVKYTQAEIDEWVAAAMEQAESNGETVTQEDILKAIGEGYILPQRITLSFTVEIELTGRSQQVTDNDPFAPIRRQPILTGGSANGSTGGNGNGSASDNGVASPDTGDAGIAVYGVLSLSAALGCCATGCTIVSRKRRRG